MKVVDKKIFFLMAEYQSAYIIYIENSSLFTMYLYLTTTLEILVFRKIS